MRTKEELLGVREQARTFIKMFEDRYKEIDSNQDKDTWNFDGLLQLEPPRMPEDVFEFEENLGLGYFMNPYFKELSMYWLDLDEEVRLDVFRIIRDTIYVDWYKELLNSIDEEGQRICIDVNTPNTYFIINNQQYWFIEDNKLIINGEELRPGNNFEQFVLKEFILNEKYDDAIRYNIFMLYINNDLTGYNFELYFR